MTSNDLIGELFRKEDVAVLEWQIEKFSTLSCELGTMCRSPDFRFLDECCELHLFPNGILEGKHEGYLRVHFVCPSRFADFVDLTLCLLTANGNAKHGGIRVFEGGFASFVFILCKRSTVMDPGSGLLPGDVLTIRCALVNEKRYPVQASLLQRLRNVSLTMLKICSDGKRSDVVFKVKGRKMKAHRVVLESRSEVFAAMFRHDTTENKTGEVLMEDVEAGVFQQVLHYIYSGQVEIMSIDGVFKLYMAADKYLLEELKDLCTAFMERNMSVDTFCDVLTIADTYNETDLMKFIKEFFTKNSLSILDSEKWEKLVSENHSVVVQLLASTVKENALKSLKRKMSS